MLAAISPRWACLAEAFIGRALAKDLQSAGQISDGPKLFLPPDGSRFLFTLDLSFG
jgi:hypothetical protein